MLCLKAKVFAEEAWPEYVTIKVLFCAKNTNGEPWKITLHFEHKKEESESLLFFEGEQDCNQQLRGLPMK